MVIQSTSAPYQISRSSGGGGTGPGGTFVFAYSQVCQFTPAKTAAVSGGTQVSGSFTCSETEQVNPSSEQNVYAGVAPSTAGKFTQVFAQQSGGLFSSTLWMTSGTCKAKYIATGGPG